MRTRHLQIHEVHHCGDRSSLCSPPLILLPLPIYFLKDPEPSLNQNRPNNETITDSVNFTDLFSVYVAAEAYTMSAGSASIKARRKSITYGKGSRRPVFGTHIPHSTDLPEDPYGKDCFKGKSTGDISDGDFGFTTTPGDRPSLSSTQYSKATDLDMRTVSSGPRQSSPPPCVSQEVYDVPSSDEGHKRPVLGTRLGHKKRKMQNHKAERIRSSVASMAKSVTNGNETNKTLYKAGPLGTKKLLSPESYVESKDDTAKLLKPFQSAKPVKETSKIRKVISPKDKAERRDISVSRKTVFHGHLAQVAPSEGKWQRRTANQNSVIESSLPPRPDLTPHQMDESINTPLNSTNSCRYVTSPQTPPKPKSEWTGENGSTGYFSPGGLDMPRLRISSTSKPAESVLRGEHLNRTRARSAVLSGSRRTRLIDKLTESYIVESDEEFDEEISSQPRELAQAISNSSEVAQATIASNPRRLGHNLQGTIQQSPLGTRSLVPAPGPRITYAAKNRTVLREQEDDLLLNATLSENLSSIKPSRRIVPAMNSHKDQENYRDAEDLEDSEGYQATSMRSIHELREAGGNARIVQEMESLLDDIENSVSISQERSALQELTKRLGESSFTRQFIDKNLDFRLTGRISSSTDCLVKTLLVAALLRIIKSPIISNSLHHMASQAIVTFLCDGVRESQNVLALAANRKSNMSRYSQAEFQRLTDSLLKSSSLWTYGSPKHLTLRSLSLQCLEYVVRYSREAGFMQDLLSARDVESLVAILVPLSGHTLSNLAVEADLLLALSILESSTVSYHISKESPDRLWTSQSLQRVIHFLTCIQGMQFENLDRIWTLALRLSLNLTNNSPSTCDLFSTVEIIKVVLEIIQANFLALSTNRLDDSQDLIIDNLVLSLGFLINLAERSEETRKLFLLPSELSQSPLDVLLQIFVSRLQDAFEVCCLLF